MDQDSAHMVAASKVPMLKPENGNTTPKTTVVEGVEKVMPPTTAEEKAQKRLEVKARSTLMMGIPNEHQLKFNSIKDAKLLMEAVEKRFGRNAATKKTQRNLLKQQYENFTAPSSEMLDKTFDRLQKLVSQLEILDEKLSQEDVNQKLLRSLSPEWNTHAVVWRNKADLDTMSMNDLYNNLKNMAFVSSSNNNTSSTNEAVNTAHGVSTASTQVNAANSTNIDNLSDVVICVFFASQPNSPQLVHEDLQQIHPDDMEEMDLRWQMAMLTMRARRFLKNTGRMIPVNGNRLLVLKSKWSSYKCHKRRHFARSAELQEIKTNKNNGKLKEGAEEGPNYALMAFSLYVPDSLYEFVNEPVVENCKAMSSEEEPKIVRKYDDAPSIKEWVSYDEEEDVSQPKTEKKTVRPNIVKKEFVKYKQQEKTASDKYRSSQKFTRKPSK
ncbi:hypothetical protein Tco_0268241 [Tanacetum coccineum]